MKRFFLLLSLVSLFGMALNAAGVKEGNSIVYEAGEGEYRIYRIPAIAKSGDTLLAFAEGRRNREDHARNDIVLRRSFDMGQTWEPMQIIHEDPALVMVNPQAVTLESGKIVLLYESFPFGRHGRVIAHMGVTLLDKGFNEGTTQRLWMRTSDDEGATWSDARDITRSARSEDENYRTAGSPNNGILLTSGEYAGRILFPLFQCYPLNDKDRIFKNSVLYSDDQGETWHRSEMVPVAEGQMPGDENSIAHTADDKIIMNSRCAGNYRRISFSEDGGATWSAFTDETTLGGSPCNGGLLAIGDQLFFSKNANNGGFLTGRTNGKLYRSKDAGASWELDQHLVDGYFGYSQLVDLGEKRVGILYEDFDQAFSWKIRFMEVVVD